MKFECISKVLLDFQYVLQVLKKYLFYKLEICIFRPWAGKIAVEKKAAWKDMRQILHTKIRDEATTFTTPYLRC